MSAFKIAHCKPLEVYQLPLWKFSLNSLPLSTMTLHHLLYFKPNSNFISVVIFKDLSIFKDCSIRLKYYMGGFVGVWGFFVFLSVFRVQYMFGLGKDVGRPWRDTIPLITSDRLLISEMEDWDYRRLLKIFELDNPASHESHLFLSDIWEIRAKWFY